MAAFAAALRSLQRLTMPLYRPRRLLDKRRVYLFAAVGAGAAGSVVVLASYYATLGLLPPAFAYPTTDYPVPAWAHRLDLAQFVGTLLDPPLPSPLTWWLGLAGLFGTFFGLSVVYAVLLAWTLQCSDVKKGIGFGAALFLGLGLTITLANGLHPAVMRNALPDTGLFLMGWSSFATVQLLLALLLYGAVVGALYRRWTVQS